MPQVPTAARRRRSRSEEDEQDGSPRQQLKLSAHLLEQVQVPHLGRPPRTDDEKREVYTSLAYLKSAGKTSKECAEALHVSERTIANYLEDSLYQDICQELQGQAVSRGHTTISMLIDDALSEIYSLMHNASSEFVRFKSAETLLNFAGYNLPRETRPTDTREDLSRFFKQVAEREQQRLVQVNVQVTQQPAGAPPTVETSTTTIVDASGEPVQQPVSGASDPWSGYLSSASQDQAFYQRPVLPGGRLPPEHAEERQQDIQKEAGKTPDKESSQPK